MPAVGAGSSADPHGEGLQGPLRSVFPGLFWILRCVSWKNGDVREQGGQPRCHQKQHGEHRKVAVSRNLFRMHFLLSHQWILQIGEGEMSVLAGTEQGIPPAEDSSARGSCRILLGVWKSSTTWLQTPGWEHGFVIALLYNKHFKTCLLPLKEFSCAEGCQKRSLE